MNQVSRLVLEASDRLCSSVSMFRAPPEVAATYNPLVYARAPWVEYVSRFATARRRSVFLGMNPGPWGMAQTGIPFGEVAAVRDWMGITGTIGKPGAEHPKRPVEGFACTKSEVSGHRLWGLMARRFGTVDGFFADHFVINYCPLVFMGESGRNITPDRLPAVSRKKLFAWCDQALAETITVLQPEFVVGVGAFATRRLRDVAERVHSPVEPEIVQILHPSPASPAANRGWDEKATESLVAAGVW